MESIVTEANERQVLTVSQLNRRARQLLETHLPLLWVEGEISNLARPSSGHWYFSLKDDAAQIRCAMFRNRNRNISFQPEDGQHLLVRGRVSLYENRGDYQLIVEHMEPAGIGALQRRFDQLKKQLAAEGLFDLARKRDLPAFAKRIGVITSPSGAAIRDVLHVLQRRFPSLPVYIYPTPVQGSEAAAGIVRALARANRHRACDLLLLTRGGGSLEDLWPFNEEIVARAIFQSEIPVVSAVGHETDICISDLVADARAPTPSAAAEMASPDQEEIRQVLEGYRRWLTRHAAGRFASAELQLHNLSKRLRHPRQVLESQQQRLDYLEMRLLSALTLEIQQKNLHLERLSQRLAQHTPGVLLPRYTERLQELTRRLRTAMQHVIDNKSQRFAARVALLQAVSPLGTLERGYAIVRRESGEIVSQIAAVQPGEKLEVRVNDGSLDCEVLAAHPINE